MEVEMKSKIESAANVIVIVLAMVVGSVFLKDRLSTPDPEPDAVKAGDKLANLDGWDGAPMTKLWYSGSGKGATCVKTARLFTRGSSPSNRQKGQTPLLWRSFRTPPMP
jgi:hypothetical protein